MPRAQRLVVALCVGLFGASLCYVNQLTPWSRPGDFAQSWFAARSMVGGGNPYELVGPHLAYDWPWPLFYPATAFVVALPFAPLPELAATLAFVFISCALLGYAITKDGWSRVPMVGSAPFIFAAGSAQWSPLFTAALTLPWLAVAYVAKPTIGIALAAAGDSRVRKYALGGGLLILAASLLLLPGWPSHWIEKVRLAPHIASPVARVGGVFIVLAVLRWRRPEAWLILTLAFVPQSGAWYEALPLFLVPETWYQSIILSIASSIGFLSYYPRMDQVSDMQVNHDVGALIVAFVYLPATIMVLMRPNEGTPPSWLLPILRRIRPARTA